jgi:protein-disulfide isomerase-like protein with CxxC motif
MAIEVIEYTDPGCSWAWGSEPKLRRLRWRHGTRLRWRQVMGGLVGDMRSYLDAFDPVAAAPGFARYWAGVASTTGMPHPVRLGWMYASTEPACLAVKAAALQSDQVATRVLRRLREETFVFGAPPDTPARIASALRDVPGLDLDRLAADCESEPVRAAFHADWTETRAPNAYVRGLEEEGEGAGGAKHTEGHWRYVFPTLVFRGPVGEATVPGWKPYERYEAALETVAPGATDAPRADPSPEEAFAVWPALAPRELEVLCGAGTPPKGVVAYDWGAGVYWLSAAEAIARGIG